MLSWISTGPRLRLAPSYKKIFFGIATLIAIPCFAIAATEPSSPSPTAEQQTQINQFNQLYDWWQETTGTSGTSTTNTDLTGLPSDLSTNLDPSQLSTENKSTLEALLDQFSAADVRQAIDAITSNFLLPIEFLQAMGWQFVTLQIKYSGLVLNKLTAEIGNLLLKQSQQSSEAVSPYALTSKVLAQLYAGLTPPLAHITESENLTALNQNFIPKDTVMNFGNLLSDLASMHHASYYYNSYGAFCQNYQQANQDPSVSGSQNNPDNLICQLAAVDHSGFMDARTLLENPTLSTPLLQAEAKTVIGFLGFPDPYEYVTSTDWDTLMEKDNQSISRSNLFSVYRANMRYYIAQKSVGLHALYFVLSRHWPVDSAGSLLQNLPNFEHQLPERMSTGEIAHLMASYRFMKPAPGKKAWLQTLTESTPATMVREIAAELNEIEILLEQRRQLNEEYTAVGAATEALLTSFLQGNLQQKRQDLLNSALFTAAEREASQQAVAQMGASYTSYTAQLQKAEQYKEQFDNSPCAQKVNNPNMSASELAAAQQRRSDDCKSYAKDQAESYCNPFKHGLGRLAYCKRMRDRAQDQYDQKNAERGNAAANNQAAEQ